MLRKTFESEIKQVKDDVLMLGSMVEHAVISSVEALKKRDIKASEKIFEEDGNINKKARRRERECSILLKISRRIIALARILDLRGTDDRHERQREGSFADGVTGHLEHAPIGGQFGELPAGVT